MKLQRLEGTHFQAACMTMNEDSQAGRLPH
jgi:hypothetical protein